MCTVTDKNLKLDKIHEKHSDLVLIGPESGFLTAVLEKPFWKVKKKKFRKHVIFYDVFGNFYYADFEEGPGYCYASPLWLPSFMKNKPLMGQISGLILCTETNFSYN